MRLPFPSDRPLAMCLNHRPCRIIYRVRAVKHMCKGSCRHRALTECQFLVGDPWNAYSSGR